MASRGVNKVILLGNVGQDPEIRYLPSGGAIANVSVATSETWQDKASGEKKERTEWHRVVFMGKLAEIVGEWVAKGSQIYVEGKLQTRKWQDQSGQDRYSTEILVDGFSGVLQLLGGRQDGGQQQGHQQQRQHGHQQHQGGGQRQGQGQGQGHHQRGGYGGQGGHQHQYNDPPMDFDDDIPF